MQSGDKRIPEAPSSSKTLPSTTPSAPRAMASSDTTRGSKSESAPSRDRAPQGGSNMPQQAQPEAGASGSGGSGSLRSRISDKEAPRSLGPAPPNSYRPEPPHEDDRDSSRKRTVSGKHCSSLSLLYR